MNLTECVVEEPLESARKQILAGTVLLGRGGMYVSNKSCSFLVCSYFLSLRIKINTEMYFPWAGTVSKNMAGRTLWYIWRDSDRDQRQMNLGLSSTLK